jgi:hypothetical protein
VSSRRAFSSSRSPICTGARATGGRVFEEAAPRGGPARPR